MDQDIFFFGNSAYITTKFLLERGVPESTIYNNTSKKKGSNNIWYTTVLPSNKKKKLIAYDSISLHIIKKYNLPDYNLLREIENRTNFKLKEQRNKGISNIVKSSLDLEYNSWEELCPLYKNKFLSGKNLEIFCKSHSVLAKIIELNDYGYKLKVLFDAYYQYDDLIFRTDNYSSFCNKIKKIKQNDCIENALIHGLTNQPSNNLKKDEDVILEIKAQYCSGKNLNGSQILEKVNDYLIRTNRKPISISSIYNVTSQNFVKNETAISRHGIKYANDHLLPYLHFEPPAYEGLLWLMDGSRFQFAYKNENKKFNFLTFFVIIDGYNKKIIGFSYDKSENNIMVKQALEMACSNKGYLPNEIISDNSSAFKTEDMERFRALFKIWGSNWRLIQRKNPRDNAYVERFFGVFQESFCKKEDGYLGDGIRSRNLFGKPSPEEIQKYLSTKNLRTREELIKILIKLISDYNDSPKRIGLMEREKTEIALNPKKKFIPITLDITKYSQIFWPSRAEKISSSEISFKIDKISYYYPIYDANLFYNLNNTRVLIRYNPKDLSKIIVFDLKNDEFIAILDSMRKVPKASFERTPADNQLIFSHSQKKSNLQKKLVKRVDNILAASQKNKEALPPKLFEFNIGSKGEIEEMENSILEEELNSLDKHPDKDTQQVDFQKIFKQMHTTKGTLKLFKYGNN